MENHKKAILITFGVIMNIGVITHNDPVSIDYSDKFAGTYHISDRLDPKDSTLVTDDLYFVLFADSTGAYIGKHYKNKNLLRDKDETYVSIFKWRNKNHKITIDFVKYDYNSRKFTTYNNRYMVMDTTFSFMNEVFNENDTVECFDLLRYEHITDTIFTKEDYNRHRIDDIYEHCVSTNDYKYLAYKSVENYIKENLNDPGSYECVHNNVIYTKEKETYTVYVKFRAKNAFGVKILNEYIGDVSAIDIYNSNKPNVYE